MPYLLRKRLNSAVKDIRLNDYFTVEGVKITLIVKSDFP